MDGNSEEHPVEENVSQPVRGTIQVGTRRSYVGERAEAGREPDTTTAAPQRPPSFPVEAAQTQSPKRPALPRLPRPAIMHTMPKGVPGPRLDIEIALVLAVLVLAAVTVQLANSRHALQQQVSQLTDRLAQSAANPQTAAQKQTQAIVNKVGKLMALPANETPTVATVTDAAAAKKQSSFFNLAQNGDAVLLYTKAGQAILYRPSTNKIIEVAPLSLTGNSTGTSTK